MKNDIEKELKSLLDDKMTGLKDSSNTNKTRYSILALFEKMNVAERTATLEWCLEQIGEDEKMYEEGGSMQDPAIAYEDGVNHEKSRLRAIIKAKKEEI